MNRLVLLVCLWSVPLLVGGQGYFNERYPVLAASPGATAKGVVPDGTGYVVAGVVYPPTPGLDLFLLFVDSVGHLRRTRTFGRPNTLLYAGFSNALLRTHDGGLTLVGSSQNPAYAGLLWRFNAQGDTLWTRSYPSASFIALDGRQELADGSFVLCGRVQLTPPSSPDDYDAILIRTDALGHERWRRTFRAWNYNDLFHILLTPDGGMLLSGFTYDTNRVPADTDWLVVKVDSLGQQQWQQTFGTPYVDGAGPALSTPDGGYLVSGSWTHHYISNHSQAQATLIKLDSTGNLLWRRSYGTPHYLTETYSFCALPDNTYVMGGITEEPTPLRPAPGGVVRGYLLKVCANGDSLWQRTYAKLTGGCSDNYLRAVSVTADGGLVGAGFIFPCALDTGTNDAWLFKTDGNGYLMPGGAPPTTQCVTGMGEAEPAAEVVSVFPNPSADGRFTLRSGGQVPLSAAMLEVTDALGRVVWHHLATGSETEVDLSAAPSGVYALRVQWATGRAAVTKRLIRW